MTNNTILPFWFPAVSRKKITAAFDGGRLTSDGGVMLLGLADRRIGVADKLSSAFPERRDRSRIVHSLADMIRARTCAIVATRTATISIICVGIPRSAGLRPAAGHGARSCSQPTLSRLENAPRLREVIRLSYALVDLWMDSYQRVPAR